MPEKHYVVSVSTDDEVYYDFIIATSEAVAKRALKLIEDNFETEEGYSLDTGMHDGLVVDDSMTDEQLLEILEAEAQSAGDHRGEVVTRKLCFAAPWVDGDGNPPSLCRLALDHDVAHDFVPLEDDSLGGREIPRTILGVMPEPEPEAPRDIPCPGQVELFSDGD